MEEEVRHLFSARKTFLGETHYCNYRSNAVEDIAALLHSSSNSLSDYAVSCYYWVRDEIKYTVGLYPHTASQTLERKHGSCTNKANLFVALLRARGIPGGFHLMRVDSSRYFGPICPPSIVQFMGSDSAHIYSCLWLDRWIKCDNTDDIALSRGACHLNPPAQPVEFNGKDDARLNIDCAHVHSDSIEPFNSVDDFLEKKARIPEVVPAIFNAFGDFVRAEGEQLNSPEEFHEQFFPWLLEIDPTISHEFHTLLQSTSESIR
jgi:hypothetical protein